MIGKGRFVSHTLMPNPALATGCIGHWYYLGGQAD